MSTKRILDLSVVEPHDRRLVIRPILDYSVRLTISDRSTNTCSIVVKKEELDKILVVSQTLRKELP